MIGVIAIAEENAIVREFFQLFKTPWEFFQEGRSYDVVLVATDEMPEVEARLVVHYGARIKKCDLQANVIARSSVSAATLVCAGNRVPIYGKALAFEANNASALCITLDSEVVGLRIRSDDLTVLRVGYDLFQEVGFLLSVGQPVENARVPAVEIHIAMLRDWIVSAGIPLLEIPPVPAGHSFIVCLTHDIDFIGIRRHKFDHTMWGFLYRSTVGAAYDVVRRRISFGRLLKMWRAAASLPFVYLGWAEDFWQPFDW